MKKFPINKIVVDVEVLGGEITLTELTQEHRVECNKDREYDTPRNGLLCAGLTNEQVDKLGEGVLIALYEEVIDLTYPNARKELKALEEAGNYTPPTEEEAEESKKNS